MGLIDSLVEVLQHQLMVGVANEDSVDLSSLISSMKPLLAEASEDTLSGLEDVLRVHLISSIRQGLTDKSISYRLLKHCLPICSGKLIEEMLEVGGLTSIEELLDFHLLLVSHPEMSSLQGQFLHRLVCHIPEAVEADNVTVAKKMGRLLRVLWHLVYEGLINPLDELMLSLYNKDMCTSSMYMILCSICDCFIKENQFPTSFWKLLSHGVKSKETVIRKQCLHMVKSVLDAFDKNLLELSDSPLMTLNRENKETTLQVWSHYVLFMESLNEKQYHIVEPNFVRLEHVLQATEKGIIHLEWLLSLFNRILSHDNMQVKKYGVLYILNLDYKQYAAFTVGQLNPVLYTDFILMANQSSFFTRRPDLNEDVVPEVFTAMKRYLTSMLQSINDNNNTSLFLHGVITTLASAPWCPVPGMYWIAALASLDHPNLKDCWDEQTLSIICNMMSKYMLLSDRRIRQATCYYLLIAITHLSKVADSAVLSLSLLLTHLRPDDILTYGSRQWKQLASVLTLQLEAGNISLPSLLSSASREEFAVLVLPLTSAAAGKNTPTLCDWLKETCEDTLNTCCDRAYVSQRSVMECLHTVTRVHHLLSVGTEGSVELGLALKEIQAFIFGISESVCDYLLSLVIQELEISDEDMDTLSAFVKLVSANQQTAHYTVSLAEKLCDRLERNVGTRSEFEWRLLNTTLSSVNTCGDAYTHLYRRVFKVFSDLASHRAGLQEQYVKWLVSYWFLSTESADSIDWMCWYSKAMDALSIMYREDTCMVFRSLAIILPQVDIESICRATRSMLIKVEEESKNSHYLPLLTSLVECVFCKSLLEREEVWDNLSEVFTALYFRGEERPGIANIISRQLNRLITREHVTSTPVSYWLVELAMYGPIHNKAHRTVEDGFCFLEETGDMARAKLAFREKRVGWSISDQEVRVVAVDSLLYLCKVSTDLFVLLRTVLDDISSAYFRLLAVKCYNNFPNALSHRQRHRLLSLLLSLLSYMHQVPKILEPLFHFLKKSLRTELQPSCRHQLEWMFIYVVKIQPLLIRSWVIDQMDHKLLVKEKASYVCSLFCIASHVCSGSHDLSIHGDQLSLMSDILPLISPWGMSSKFHMRIHAQAALLKIWQHAKDQQLIEKLSARFPLLAANMEFALHSGTATEKNSRKLLENFFYFKFDAVKDWSLETIFSLWPRLLTLAEGESIPYRMFSEESIRAVGATCVHTELRTCDPGTWHIKVKEGDNENELNCSDLQRKVTTWRTMNPALDSSVEHPLRPGTTHNNGGLILVTSLIDKLPNLGGLCRTAEIFGATEMVVNSLKVMEDSNFLSTSVTAHQWISMKQVPAHCLPDYLQQMKEEHGYTIVGVEQATNSKSLASYQMPSNTLLLLGNEKQGIPAHLLQLVDVCVEIPQQGVIRSLNVHVSGALLIWEYRKQRLMEEAISTV